MASRGSAAPWRSSSRLSSYAARNPRNVMTVPEAANSATSPADVGPAAMTTDAVDPFASAICDAMVRFQMRS